MTGNIDNVVIEHLKALRNEVQTFRTETRDSFADLKQRVSSLERAMVAVKHEMAAADETDVRQQLAIDKIIERIERIERRLEINN